MQQHSAQWKSGSIPDDNLPCMGQVDLRRSAGAFHGTYYMQRHHDAFIHVRWERIQI